jgi:ribosome biogenesis GTPase / thiamine phosphate phosphatase
MAKPKGPAKSGRGGRRAAGRGRAPQGRGQQAALAARRREQEGRIERDRAKLLARYEAVEPDGRVLCQFGTHAETALADGQVKLCMLTPKVHKVFGVCVGDRVWTEQGASPDERVIVARQPRRNEVRRKRGEDDRTGHVICANVSKMAITAALKEPPLRTGALDRYLVLASIIGLEPLIVINKSDQSPPEDPEWAALAPYRELGVPIVATSAETGAGLDELLEALRGSVTVFAGHSGVGKSSICRALGLEGAPIAGDMSYARGRVRGRHTTSIARLLDLPGADGWVVDTPGVRAIGLVDLERSDARIHFGEFDAYAGDCEYADCLHLADEDGCAVVRALERGKIPRVRYDGYVRLMESLDE